MNDPFPGPVACPGITPGFPAIQELLLRLPEAFRIFAYKRDVPCLWIVFLGGTGTGKSTLFNALCGKSLSETGVERPKTSGPVAYAHEGCLFPDSFPFPTLRPVLASVETLAPAAGSPDQLLVRTHRLEQWAHLVLVDTPDLDSVAAENREAAENLYSLADGVVFVASQEKYADEVPNRLLARIPEDGKIFFFLLNKAREDTSMAEIAELLGTRGVPVPRERMWAIPYFPSLGPEQVSTDPRFRHFVERFQQEFSGNRLEAVRKDQLRRSATRLTAGLGRLLPLLGEEKRAAEDWVQGLDRIHREVSAGFIREHKDRLKERTREQMGREIRKLFARYDLLAVPRKILGRILLAPFRLLWPAGEEGDRKKTLLKVRQKIDLAPVQRALEELNLAVLQRLSPPLEASPLYAALRRPEVVMGSPEVKARILEAQDRLDTWVEETFSRLAAGIPRSKKWGIYTTAILWGILIVALETVVGGGFTVLDAALDSALAPFVTRGAMEVFAYQEIRRIAREMADRYQDGLLSILSEQRERHEKCLRDLSTPSEVWDRLRDLHAGIDRWKRGKTQGGRS